MSFEFWYRWLRTWGFTVKIDSIFLIFYCYCFAVLCTIYLIFRRSERIKLLIEKQLLRCVTVIPRLFILKRIQLLKSLLFLCFYWLQLLFESWFLFVEFYTHWTWGINIIVCLLHIDYSGLVTDMLGQVGLRDVGDVVRCSLKSIDFVVQYRLACLNCGVTILTVSNAVQLYLIDVTLGDTLA